MSCGLFISSATDSSRLRAVATGSDGGLEGFKAYSVFKEIEGRLLKVKKMYIY